MANTTTERRKNITTQLEFGRSFPSKSLNDYGAEMYQKVSDCFTQTGRSVNNSFSLNTSVTDDPINYANDLINIASLRPED